MIEYIIQLMCQYVFLRELLNLNCDIQQLKALDANYGVTWMFMPDDNGMPHIVDLTQPNDTYYGDRKGNMKKDVTFYYFRQPSIDANNSFKFDPDAPLTLFESYDPSLPTKFIIHGWFNSMASPSTQKIKNSYLKNGDMNVFIVDWGQLAADMMYYTAATAIRDVGGHVGALIDRMVAERGTNLKDVHIIGHSLGAHTAGLAGAAVAKGKVGRVTGLDPALPWFTDPINRLDPGHAQFVDVIHTCAGMMGHDKSLGHADFWPNGGTATQPGCASLLEELMGACSHGRAYEYFAESITRPLSFLAYSCTNIVDFHDTHCQSDPVPMGEATPSSARGNYFLDTNPSPMYGKGLKALSALID
ncbi:lipase member H-like [Anopheles bellator]|uniref:lipase member H-like n=1 Tax=Anopheles bellator TaxID=139047 RepID=UPI00264946CC|nr:lipase member H-like [Anopheles bellator]